MELGGSISPAVDEDHAFRVTCGGGWSLGCAGAEGLGLNQKPQKRRGRGGGGFGGSKRGCTKNGQTKKLPK